MKTLLLVSLALSTSLLAPQIAEAGCSANSLPVHSSWNRTGTYRGDVVLPSNQRARASGGEKVCIIYYRNDRKVYGQWKCDTRDDRFEYVQNLSLKSSYEDPKMCDHRFSRSSFRPR